MSVEGIPSSHSTQRPSPEHVGLILTYQEPVAVALRGI